MESSEIVGPLKLSRNDYNVKYLNLGHCNAGPGVLEKLISSCQSIQKLSLCNLCNLELNSNAVKSLSHKKLQTLDLNAFKDLNLKALTNILSCKTLTEVSFRCNYLSDDDSDNLVQYLVENLSSDIKKVSFSGAHYLTDEHVKTLVKRCKKIKELELGHCRRLTEASLTSIVEHCDQMVKLDVSYTKIDLSRDWNGWNGGPIPIPIPLLLPIQGRNSFLKVS